MEARSLSGSDMAVDKMLEAVVLMTRIMTQFIVAGNFTICLTWLILFTGGRIQSMRHRQRFNFQPDDDALEGGRLARWV
jgi:hypothetical protein